MLLNHARVCDVMYLHVILIVIGAYMMMLFLTAIFVLADNNLISCGCFVILSYLFEVV